MSAYPHFLQALARLPAIPTWARIRIAISGGPDSTALLGLFLELRAHRRPDLELSAGHVDHTLRGAESDLDASHCREHCKKLSLPFVSERVDVRARAEQDKTSLETAARDVRREIFARWGREDALFAVATGHSADDQVETVLGNILRGTGVRGLRGMREARTLAGAPGTLHLRPLLAHTRAELVAFCSERGHSYRIDSSNAARDFRRNRLRLDLLPQLEREYNPEVRAALLGLAEDALAHEQMCADALVSILARAKIGPRVALLKAADLDERSKTPRALLAPLLDALWEELTGRGAGLTRDHHRAWIRLISGGRDGASYDLPDGWSLQRAGGRVYLLHASTPPDDPDAAAIRLRIPGEASWPWLGLTVRIRARGNAAIGAQQLEVPAEWSASHLELRPPRAGDRIRLGVGHKEVAELLRAHGLPKPMRNRFPVLAKDGIPCWLPGIPSASPRRGAGSDNDYLASIEVAPAESPEAFIFAQLLWDSFQ